jgi:hypothetical protein
MKGYLIPLSPHLLLSVDESMKGNKISKLASPLNKGGLRGVRLYDWLAANLLPIL